MNGTILKKNPKAHYGANNNYAMNDTAPTLEA